MVLYGQLDICRGEAVYLFYAYSRTDLHGGALNAERWATTGG
jgi:hypothetical protein